MKKIRTRSEHRRAIAEIHRLMKKSPSPKSNNGRRLGALARIAEEYEKKHFKI